MKPKPLIWLTGGYGSGKTSQMKNLLFVYNGNKANPITEQIQGDGIYYTLYPKSGIAVIGKMGKNQCTGLDSVYSQIKAEGVVKSIEAAVNDTRVKYIFMECVFATYSWYENMVRVGLKPKLIIIFIHFEMSLFYNFRRIQQRRAVKQNIEDWQSIELEDTVYKNAGNKNRETRVVYKKMAGEHSKVFDKQADYVHQFDAMTPLADLGYDVIDYITNILMDCR